MTTYIAQQDIHQLYENWDMLFDPNLFAYKDSYYKEGQVLNIMPLMSESELQNREF